MKYTHYNLILHLSSWHEELVTFSLLLAMCLNNIFLFRWILSIQYYESRDLEKCLPFQVDPISAWLIEAHDVEKCCSFVCGFSLLEVTSCSLQKCFLFRWILSTRSHVIWKNACLFRWILFLLDYRVTWCGEILFFFMWLLSVKSHLSLKNVFFFRWILADFSHVT